MKKKNNKKGFTLIELLVVIAIIGLLSTLAVIALSKARQKARDSKRESDAKVLQTAIEMYATDNGAAPTIAKITAANGGTLTWDALGVALQDQLPQGVPHDPGDKIWCYCDNSDSGKYLIAVGLEETKKDIPGDLDADLTAVQGTYNSPSDCICSDNNQSNTINCEDLVSNVPAGQVESQSGEVVFCLGSI